MNILIPQNPGLKLVTIATFCVLYNSVCSYQLLSNDNGFLNFGPPHFFDQRTLTARFLMNLTK